MEETPAHPTRFVLHLHCDEFAHSKPQIVVAETPMTPTSPRSTPNPTIPPSKASPATEKPACTTSQIPLLNQERQT